MPFEPIDALSPLDGRYFSQLAALRAVFSESGLMRARVRVECAWFLTLSNVVNAEILPKLPDGLRAWLGSMATDPAATAVAAIKTIESRTNHDVKAVEYWLRDEMKRHGASAAQLEWMHFGCTSEDINNLAYALMLSQAREQILLPTLQRLCTALDARAKQMAGVAMLSRTHGQSASPTTVGKELANVMARLTSQIQGLRNVVILGKMNGAVGNFNAHVAALPAVHWPEVSRAFVASLGLVSNPYTTQIEPHDWIAEYCHALARINTVAIDFARDMWSYISIGYFKQRSVAQEVGSSTMPHKINPIDFENAEGNFGISNALLYHFAEKLPISRWQRDLSDSTVLRNLGVGIGHAVLAYESLHKGIAKLDLDVARISADLDNAWEVLGEAVQTVMRAHGILDGYDRLKDFSRGRRIDRESLHAFIAQLELPDTEKQRLTALTPANYLGLSVQLANGET